MTDAEGILGMGDWGVNGVDIAIGKLMVYTAAAGINPAQVLPVSIDAGTNNETLLNNPLYLGIVMHVLKAILTMTLLTNLLKLQQIFS